MTDSSCAKLIKKITSIPRQGDCFRIDERLLGGVKKLCKASDSNVEECMRYLLVDLAHKHGIVRLRSLAVIEVLFARSRRCREITAAGIQLVAAAGGLSMQSHQWPAGIDHEKVRRKVVYLVELWDQSHGHEYPSIFSMAKYFRETMRVRMPDTVVSVMCVNWCWCCSRQLVLANFTCDR